MLATTDKIEKIIDDVLGVEGGYSNDKEDLETMWGITIRTARAHGYTGAMINLPREEAKRIYRESYIKDPGFDKIIPLYPNVAAELIDTGVNMGQAVAGEFLQRSLNALVNAGLVVDGKIGKASRAALEGFFRTRGARGEIVLLRALNALQGEKYITIVEKNPAKRKYIYGWFDNRVVI